MYEAIFVDDATTHQLHIEKAAAYFAALVCHVCPATAHELSEARLRCAIIEWYGLKDCEWDEATELAKAVYGILASGNRGGGE